MAYIISSNETRSLTGWRCLTAVATAALAPAWVEGAGRRVKMAVEGTIRKLFELAMSPADTHGIAST